MSSGERERLRRRAEKARRRLALGKDERKEKDGTVSERAILDRIEQLLKAS